VKAEINGARIHYRREGSGFPVVMLHAAIADSRMWQPQMDEFARTLTSCVQKHVDSASLSCRRLVGHPLPT
jgi:pimeloyl-ACP methyl ester carboxylesterase